MKTILKKLMLGNGKTSIQKGFMWNALGSGIFSATTMIYSVAVTRAVGAEKGGMFAIAFTVCQIMGIIAHYEVRTFQVTDVAEEFRFKDYFTMRIVTCGLMILASLIYIFLRNSSPEKAIIMILFCFYRMVDGFADVFEGMFQKSGRLDIAGKSVAYRTILSGTCFVLSVFMTKDIIFASIIAVITAVIGIILFDFMIIDEFANIELNLKFELQKKLFTACTPIFLGLFMSNYILNASRIAVDKVMESEYQAYYAAISMPTFIIVLFAGFGFKPLLTNLAISYEKGEMKRFVSILSKTGAMTIAFTILCMLAAYLAGIPVLSFIYNLELSHYRVPLMILLLAGGINAINMIQYYTLTIMRQQKIVFIGYFITFVSSFIISNTFVEKWGIMGAALSYLCLMMLLFGIFVAFISMINRKRYGKNSTFSRIKNKE